MVRSAMADATAPGSDDHTVHPVEGAAVDSFTFAHGAVGVLLNAGDVPFLASVGLATLLALVDHPAKRVLNQLAPVRPNRPAELHALADIAAVGLGWWAMHALRKREGDPGP